MSTPNAHLALNERKQWVSFYISLRRVVINVLSVEQRYETQLSEFLNGHRLDFTYTTILDFFSQKMMCCKKKKMFEFIKITGQRSVRREEKSSLKERSTSHRSRLTDVVCNKAQFSMTLKPISFLMCTFMGTSFVAHWPRNEMVSCISHFVISLDEGSDSLTLDPSPQEPKINILMPAGLEQCKPHSNCTSNY